MRRSSINDARELTEEEVEACRHVELKLAALVGQKVSTEHVRAGMRAPPVGILTPALVRAIVSQAVEGTYRRAELETFILRRLTVNGERFDRWEADPTVLRVASVWT